MKGYYDPGFGNKVQWDIPLLEGYDHAFLKNYSPKPGTNNKFINLVNPGIIRIILREKPDILWVHGWSYFTIWLSVLACKISGTKIWMKCESPLNQELKKSKVNQFIKRFILQWFLFRLIDKFLYIGNQNKLFYIYYGVPENKLIFSPYAVDNARFSAAFQSLQPNKSRLRETLGIPLDHLVILFSGKFISKKRPLDILEAFVKVNLPNTSLIFLGDGELRTVIEERIQFYQAKNVTITGFINQSEISTYYAISDIFVLPSDVGETWGLVVNEAMNFGLPVLVSDMPGSGYDLVKNGVNGYTFPVGDITSLTERLKELCLSPEKMDKFGQASLEIVKSFSYERSIQEIEKSLFVNK